MDVRYMLMFMAWLQRFCRRLSAKTPNIDLMEGKLSENLFLTEANCIAHISLCERYTHQECVQYGCWLRYQCEDW